MAPLGRRFGRPGLIGLAARTAVVAGTATAVHGAVASTQQRQAAGTAPVAAAPEAVPAAAALPAPSVAPVPATEDVASALERLSALHRSGVIDDAEFSAAKSKILL